MKISIITVCRNDRKGLEKTFESIRAQISDAFEWWAIDGGSNDGTVEWLNENHNHDGGWTSEPDEGIYDAMNKGIGLAEGDYLLFLNSGDMLAGPNIVSKLLRRIEEEENAPDFVYGDALDIEESGRSHYRKARSASHIRIGMPARHQSMLYRRAEIAEKGYPADLKLSGDYALTANLLMKDDVKTLKVDFPVCHFSLGGQHDILRLQALREDFMIRRKILRENPATCALLFCVHWVHHYLRTLLPGLNRKFIYDRPIR